ncbi:sporulation protein [Pontibacillus halophilus JSM 076056 = DSM 19796]|uniref:Sporulation protein n=1 Tax=Pontibacillus halophilus JSM 076056 = DSM 19796 TaxID=1385510 RepID=A0A0A5GJ44_9BACI|nr:sporulation integral membrane protein YlbJ [Pontibacillus halophilus]KGX93281.1 sporulation protein [Pontibacillus halophilus JSM 076056 = DSM 19796]
MKSQLKTIGLAGVAVFMAASLIVYPDQALEASIRGLNMWWEIVFPSLLPFFITAELLIGFGVVRFIGVLCEPIMRPIFKVPGVGSFVWVMGMASGYPSGAKLTARLREEKQLTKIEAERLVSFTNASNPLFIFGAVSIGFFHNPTLGLLLAVSHYVGNAIVGVIMRFYGGHEISTYRHERSLFSLRRAFEAMHETRLKDDRPFGRLFGDAVLSSIQTLLVVGGFIIIFSVLSKLLFLVGITEVLGAFLAILFGMAGLSGELSLPFISGLFEITLGSQMTSTSHATLQEQVMIVSFILGFNGFSIQAQVASILAETDIRFLPYFIARILHGVIASTLSFFFFQPLYVERQAFHQHETPVLNQTPLLTFEHWFHWIVQIGPLVTIGALAVGAWLLIYNRSNRNKPLS